MSTNRQQNNNNLAKEFDFFSLLSFAFPNIMVMIFMSLYTIVDGMFVSRYLGTTALSTINIVYPIGSLGLAIGLMFASGGSAIIGIRMGENKNKEAKEFFSFIVWILFILGLIIGVLGNIFLKDIVLFFGATDSQLQFAIDYQRILFYFQPAYLLQIAFLLLIVTDGRPVLGLVATVSGGLTNIILDYIFLEYTNMGIAGAALATGLGYLVPVIICMIRFIFIRSGNLYLIKPVIELKTLVLAMYNGSSEMVSNLAGAITTFMYNYLLLKYYGEDGVAAITIVLYFQFILSAVYFGYSMGIAPIISYKYGELNKKQIKDINRISLKFLSITAIISYFVGLFMLEPVMGIFLNDKTSNVHTIVVENFWIFAISLSFMSMPIYASSLFTAFSDGTRSAIISFARSFVFLVSCLIIFPLLLGGIGIWIAVPVAEGLGLIVAIYYLYKYRHTYYYA